MGVYINNQLVYVVNGTQLNTQIALNPGPEHTVVEEWDYCGGATFTTRDVTVVSSTTPVVNSPTAGTTISSPVQYSATAVADSCSQGIASMGVYVNNQLIYVVNGTQINTQITMNPGPEHTVVEEWDYCGGAEYTTVDLTVASAAKPAVTITADSPTITPGSSSTLTVTATNATQASISGSDGSSYTLQPNGGSVNVNPGSTTTYTANASGSAGQSSGTATVTVIPASSLNAIQHVVLMLQENRSFDSYFGMLNPYRHTNGWNTGDDGKEYDVDGIDDKLSAISNQDDEGDTYSLYKFRTTCIDDLTSDWLASYGQVDRWNFLTTRPIVMDGFVHNAEGYAKSCSIAGAGGSCSGSFTDTSGQRSMGYYDQGFLNYYYYMASQFALSDRWFSPMSTKSIGNRVATFTGGTMQGLVRDPGNEDQLPQLAIATIFKQLDQANVSWKIYYTVTQGFCFAGDDCNGGSNANYPATDFSNLTYSFQYLYENPSGAACTPPTQPSSVVGDASNSFCVDPNHIAPISQYFTDVSNGTLPSFAFIEAGYGNNDEHPGSGQSILNGQVQVAHIVNSLMSSPSWSNSVFFLSYDEGGGPYDHVPPVPGHSNDNTDTSLGAIPDILQIAVNADGYNPCVPANGIPTLHCDLNSSDPGAASGDAAAQEGFAAQLGFRVPNIVISPFARRHYVSHVPMDHTAIIKFVENRFIGSSANLTHHDAAQPDLLDFFDFNSVPWATAPAPPAPVTPSTLGYDPCLPQSLGP
jgi:phospholipase C